LAELVIMFAGPMGSGKTAAVQTLSEIDVVLTEVANSDRQASDKATTTVALDYGEITVGDDEKVRLYGVPGQKRFSFMWRIIRERAIGMVLLVGNDGPSPIDGMLEFLDEFDDFVDRSAVVIGVTRSDLASSPTLADYRAALDHHRPGMSLPVVSVDTRNRGQMRVLLMTLVESIQTRALIPASASASTSASTSGDSGGEAA
jgi:signal recognition particle receptor subunit beta